MKKRSKLRASMLRATLLPVLIFGICIIICSVRQIESSVYQEVESGLENVAQMTMYLICMRRLTLATMPMTVRQKHCTKAEKK